MNAYGPFLASGLWHVHTEVTDGEHDAATLLEAAERAGFPLVGFAEHVRQEPTYDFEAFADRIDDLAGDYDLEVVVGCEAKVLDTDGTLDASDAILDRADVVYAAYHGTPFTRAEYVESVHAMLDDPVVDVWAHPFDYPAREGFSLSDRQRREVFDRLEDRDVRFELNLRRPAPDLSRSRIAALLTIVGYDLHDLGAWPGLSETAASVDAE